MTDREEFGKWWRETKGTDIPYTGLASFTEDVMFSAWQARGELDAVRIKELESFNKHLGLLNKENLTFICKQKTEIAELTVKLDKARDGDCCTEGCIKCDAREVLKELDK